MKPIEYELEIYEPKSADDCWVTFSSTSPFPSINKGDIVNPSLWSNSQSPMKVLRVINVEHLIWEINAQIRHKLMVFTEEVDGTRELRLTA